METAGFSISMDFGTIFIGLVTLFFIIFLAYKATAKNTDITTSGAAAAPGKGSMEEIAAAIGMALHIYVKRQASRAITIKRKQSAWKDVQRERFMQRL